MFLTVFGWVSEVGFLTADIRRLTQMFFTVFGWVSEVGFLTADIRRLTQINADVLHSFWFGVRGWFFNRRYPQINAD